MSALAIVENACLPLSRREHVRMITDGHSRIYRDIVAIGGMLVQARKDLPRGEFLAMLATDLPFSQRTAYNYMTEWAIAQDDLQPVATMSEAYSVRAEIERLSPDELAQGVAAGKIFKGVSRSQVIEYRKELRADQEHRPGHLDIPAPSRPVGPMSSAGAAPLLAGSYSELVWLLIERRKFLGFSGEAFDHHMGWTQGMTSKLEIPHRPDGRMAGHKIMQEWLQGLRCGLQVVPL